MSQEELAARMKQSQRFVSRCESQERRVDFFELRDWCEATGISLQEFLERLDRSLAEMKDQKSKRP